MTRPVPTLDLVPPAAPSEFPEPWPGEEFAWRLKVGRVLAKWTREELAHEASVDAESIRSYEQERRSPRADTLRLIVLALRKRGVNASADWLLGLKGKRWEPE